MSDEQIFAQRTIRRQCRQCNLEIGLIRGRKQQGLSEIPRRASKAPFYSANTMKDKNSQNPLDVQGGGRMITIT